MKPFIALRRLALPVLLLAVPMSAQAQLTEGFDNITTLGGSGWVQTNNSSPLGTTSWFQGNAGIFAAHSGAENSYIAANFENTGDLGTISNWLITPMLTLTNGSVFSFYTRGAFDTFPDRLELRLSTAGSSSDVGSTATSVGDFTMLWLSINPALGVGGYPTGWTLYTVTLSGLAGELNGRFALRYFVEDAGLNGANSNYIGIDDVSYRLNTSTVPEPASVVLTAAGLLALGLVNRRRRSMR